MSEILSQDEIDQLLNAISDGSVSEREDYEPIHTKRIRIYDFARPDVLSRESIRFFSSIMEENMFNLTKLWQKIIPNIKHMHLSSVDQLTFEEFIRSIPTPTYLMLGMSGKFPIALELDPLHPIFYKDDLIADFDKEKRNVIKNEKPQAKKSNNKNTKINKLKKLEIPNFEKELSDIVSESDIEDTKISKTEKAINNDDKKEKNWVKDFAKNVSKPMILSLLKIWQKYIAKQLEIPFTGFKIETNPQFLTYHYEENFKSKDDEMYFIPSAMTLLFTIEVTYNDDSYNTICIDIPWKFAQQMLDMYNGIYNEKKQPSSFSKNFLSDIKVPVEVSLGSTNKSITDILNMGEGTILELNKFAGEPVDIKVSGKKVAEGEVVIIEENYGVRITNCLTK